ncbi:MAG TPA: AAA family ATPase, partial [Longimicrobiales bacterium]
MSRVIAIVNQKGGVGKTTTAINLGASFAVAERHTLVIDMDPQGNATSGLGVNRADIDKSMYEVLVDQEPLQSAIIPHLHFKNLDLVPSDVALVGAEVQLVEQPDREMRLRRALETVRN